MRFGVVMVVGLGSGFAVADTHDRPRLEDVAPSAPAWARDCTLDLVQDGPDAFSVAVACRGSEELVFERRAMTSREFEAHAKADADELGAARTKLSISTALGAATGYTYTLEGAERQTRVMVRRGSAKGPSDVYVCTSLADADPLTRCKLLLETFARSTVIRRGSAAFPRPKS